MPISRLSCRRDARPDRLLRRAEAALGQAGFRRSAGEGARSGARQRRRALPPAERFTHFFIDEFQDTDPVQAEILLLLSADDPKQSDWRVAVPEPGKLFIVGDPKQSIYKFRRADVLLYQEIRERLVARGVRAVVHERQPPRGGAHPAMRQCRVRAGDGGERREGATRLRAARRPSGADRRPARGDRLAGAAAVEHARHHQSPRSTGVCRMPSPRSSNGW